MINISENIKLTREQVIFLTFIGVIGNVVYTHTWIDDITDRSAWVATFLGILLLIPFAIWIFHLGKFNPKGTVFDMIEVGLGKFTSSTLSFIFILINLAIAVVHLNMFTEMINVFFLEHTPPWLIMLFIILIGVLFAKGEIKSFGRLTEILGILGIINYFTAFVFSFPKMFQAEYVLPIFDTSFVGFIKGTLFMTSATAEGLLLLMIIVRYIPDPHKHYIWVVKGIGFSAFIIASAIMVIIGVMSPELAKRVAFGGVNAAKTIQVGEFIRGLEVFLFGTYQFIAIGRITLSIYCAWVSSKKIFNNKLPILQLWVIALLILAPSVWLFSYNRAYFLAVFLGNYIILPFSILILTLASVSAYIKRKKLLNKTKI